MWSCIQPSMCTSAFPQSLPLLELPALLDSTRRALIWRWRRLRINTRILLFVWVEKAYKKCKRENKKSRTPCWRRQPHYKIKLTVDTAIHWRAHSCPAQPTKPVPACVGTRQKRGWRGRKRQQHFGGNLTGIDCKKKATLASMYSSVLL